MKELSLHILDVAENGISAGADQVAIEVIEDRRQNRLTLVIADNGRGIPMDQVDRAIDPFYTSRTTRRVGMGLSLLNAAARQCDGHMWIDSDAGKGTRITAEFVYDHIDRAPVGDMAATMISLIMGSPGIDFEYRHEVDGREFVLNTREVKSALDGRQINDPEVFQYIMETLRTGENRLRQGG
ncbi:MAG: ATP-binding protein [Desulfobacterales bacterium]|nr:ATP-binding protein [Desulfobacterales bacterium]